jgi:hypothetical protein
MTGNHAKEAVGHRFSSCQVSSKRKHGTGTWSWDTRYRCGAPAGLRPPIFITRGPRRASAGRPQLDRIDLTVVQNDFAAAATAG